MEHPSVPGNSSRDQKCVGVSERAVPCTCQGTKIGDVLVSNKPNFSYADFHHEITRDPDDALPEYVGSQQSQLCKRATTKEDELVRYMSNLPSYLEKGRNFQEKALSVGVLDWKLLEKWRYSQKQMSHKHNGYSPSSSNSSPFSTDGSSTHSSRGLSCSPAHQRMYRRSLQSPLEASPKEGPLQDDKSCTSRGISYSPARQTVHNPVLQSHPMKVYAGEGQFQEDDFFGQNSGKFQDATVRIGNHLSGHHKDLGALPHCKRKDSGVKLVSEMGQRPAFNKYEGTTPWKGKDKILGSESTNQTLKLRETKMEPADCYNREKSGVLTMPVHQSENSYSKVASSAFTVNGHLPVDVDQKTISRKNYGNKLSGPNESYSPIPESMKNPCRVSDVSHHSTKMLNSSSRICAEGMKGASSASPMLSFPARLLNSPSRSRNTAEKPLAAGIRSANSRNPSVELDIRKSSNSIPKTRNPSPIRRLSFAMGKMIKNAGSRDNSPVRRSNTKDGIAKSGSDGAVTSSSIDSSFGDKSSNNNRGGSSPLRRLLDPLLKFRASNSCEPSNKKHSFSMVGTTKSCNDRPTICPEHSVKIKSRSPSCSSTSVISSHHNSKNGSSSLQALLQVSFKNGFPLFTFAIDNESNILAATLRKSFVPGKGHHNWTYTFFTVREVKRKSGIWLNHGGKGHGLGYHPNIVAQMKVSDSYDSSHTMCEITDDHFTREFNLFAVDVRCGDHYASDFHPTNELAAIVVKLPRISSGDPCEGDQSSYSWLDSSLAFRGKLQETRSSEGFADDFQNRHSLGSQNLTTTVVLPGGVHTVPSKGEMSTLAQRWRSGGSCDCGGWDLGCQLQVYTNQREHERRTGSSATCVSEDKFWLFSQVGQHNQPMLSLAPFKERIYSIEFNSSLSLLQVFAVCISFLDCRRPAEISEPSNVVGKFASELGVYEVPLPLKTSNHEIGPPARFVSYAPHSPVGRV